MKRKITVRFACLIVAAVVLGGAVAFAAVAGSPYETLKRAALSSASLGNVTIESEMTVRVDGVVQQLNKSFQIISENANLNYSFDEDGNTSGYYFSKNGLRMSGNPAFAEVDGTEWFSAYVTLVSDNRNDYHALFSPEELNSASMRFAELLVDLVVGDLKNNLTMTTGDGVRTIRGTFTGNQVPEIANAGIDMILEQESRYYFNRRNVSFDGKEYVYEDIRISGGTKTSDTWKQQVRALTEEEAQAWTYGNFWDIMQDVEYYGVEHIDGGLYLFISESELIHKHTGAATRADYGDDPLSVPIKSLEINYVRGEAEIDSGGILRSLNINGSADITNVFGETNAIEIVFTAGFSDVGKSNPTSPIPGAEQVLTHENMNSRFGGVDRYGLNVYFTLNTDGSINEDSITTTYPGERERSGSEGMTIFRPNAIGIIGDHA